MAGDESELMTLLRGIVARDSAAVTRSLSVSPGLATLSLIGEECFLEDIAHYMYAGDTALHAAAAAHRHALVPELVGMGADVRARNRRGAQPLHYAADGIPGSARWNSAAQRDTIVALLVAGADPNAADKGGVTPLHRAVRNRCASAVRALLEGGADARRPNASGSTQLARWTTGRGGSGLPVAQVEREEIERLLIEHGAEQRFR